MYARELQQSVRTSFLCGWVCLLPPLVQRYGYKENYKALTHNVFNVQIFLRRYVYEAIACPLLPHGHFTTIKVATYNIDYHSLRALRVKYITPSIRFTIKPAGFN